MKYNGTTVPNYRDDTYNKDEVHRKTSEELYDTAFNEDQQKVLDNFEPSGGGSLPDVTSDDNGDILTVIDGEWGKAEPGFKCVEARTVVLNETVTTVASTGGYNAPINPSQPITGDSIFVTLDGTEYELPQAQFGYGEFSGMAPVFTTYPCFVSAFNTFDTPAAGTYSVKIELPSESVETSECFEKAVEKVVPPLKYVKDYIPDDGGVVENFVVGASVKYVDTTYTAIDATANKASGILSHAEGGGMIFYDEAPPTYAYTTASGNSSHAEGLGTTASGEASHAEGELATASGKMSHAEGYHTTASGDNAHAEGYETMASGDNAHAEGNIATASGNNSHAEGNIATASGQFSHAEGQNTTASGRISHAEGASTTASGNHAHAQNENTIAQGKDQTAIGKFNVAQGTNNSIATTDYAFIIGNGTDASHRSNAFAIKWDGTFVFANGTEITPAQFASLLALLN